MCGRYTTRFSAAQLVEAFEIFRAIDDLRGVFDTPRYNVAPTTKVPVIRETDHGRDISLMRWGLVPPWSKDPKKGPPLINARCETVGTLASFRSAIKTRRCIVPMSGYFEWDTVGKVKVPYIFEMADKRPFGLAGLWETWGDGEERIESCTILTTTANDLQDPLHDRMPVILSPVDYSVWLTREKKEADEFKYLYEPFPSSEMVMYQVNQAVNSVKNQGVECVEPCNSL